MKHAFAVSIGGAAGQGVAAPGDIFARIFAQRGLHLNAYNAYQSTIRGGHTFLTVRTGPERVTSFGDKIDLRIPLNQDTMDRHLGLLGPGAAVVYNGETIKPGAHAEGNQLCPLPISELTHNSRTVPGLRICRHVQSVRDIQSRQHLRLVQDAGKEVGG